MGDKYIKLAEDKGTMFIETHTDVREHPKILSFLCQSGLGHPIPRQLLQIWIPSLNKPDNETIKSAILYSFS